MILSSHIVYSQTFFYVSCVITAHPPNLIQAIVCAISAGIISDLDTRQSKVGRLVPWLSGYIEDNFGHRTVTHCFLAHLIVGFVLYYTVSFGIFLAIIVGWSSHAFADMQTQGCVYYFWPAKIQCCLPCNDELRVRVGSVGELWLVIFMALVVILLSPWAMKGTGTSGIVRETMANVGIMVKQYQNQKGSNAWYAEVEGTGNKDLKNKTGEYLVVDTASESSLWLEDHEGKLVTVGESQSTDWHVSSMVLRKGEPQSTTTFDYELKSIKVSDLKSILDSLNADKIYFKAKGLVGTNSSTEEKEFFISKIPSDWVWFHDMALMIVVKHSPEVTISEIVIPENKPDTIDKIEDESLDNELSEQFGLQL